MKTWKLLTLLVLAGVVPIGISNDQWLGDMKQWLKSIPMGKAGEAPALQTTAYGGSSSSSDNSNSASSGTSSSTINSANGSKYSSGSGSSSSWSTSGTGSSSGSGLSGASGTGNGSSTGAGSSHGLSGSSGSVGSDASYGKSTTPVTTVSGSSGTSVVGASGAGRDVLTSNQAASAVGKSEEGESPVEGGSVANFQEVFRFDIHPKWVLSRWPRVTTVLAEPSLEGLRVPLVTGKNADDISGSLTYYFDQQKMLQRISFVGYTGDERRLARLAVESYGMKPVPSLSAGLFMLTWNGKPRSVLRLSLLPVVRATDTNRRLEVMLEINRPRAYYGLSREFKEVLDQDRATSRW